VSTTETDPAAQLDALHAAGVLTDAEYQDAKTRLDAAAASAPEPPPPATNLPPADAEAKAGQEPPEPSTDAPAPEPSPPVPEAAAAAQTAPEDAVAATEPPPALAIPCPSCGHPETVVATATPAAVPYVDVNGEEVAGGTSVHACPHCGSILEQLVGELDDAWHALEERRQADEQAAAEAAATTTTTEGGTNGTQT